jgi:excisionase family DNA binding protein
MKEKRKNGNELLSITEAAKYARIGRQAIWIAIKNKKLKAIKKGRLWRIKPEDIDAYRKNKYNREARTINGEPVYNIEEGLYSVQHVARIFSHVLKRPFLTVRNFIYSKLHSGNLPSFKKGASWIITKEDAEALLKKELEKNEDMDQYQLKLG